MIIQDDEMYYEALQEVSDLLALDAQDDAKLHPDQIERMLRLIYSIDSYEEHCMGRPN